MEGTRVCDVCGRREYPHSELVSFGDLIACCYAMYPEDIDALLAEGVSLEEIEEYLYCG